LVDKNDYIAISGSLFSKNLMDKKTKEILDNAPSHIYSQIKTNIRGAYTNSRTQ
jgi:hypothetical protein